MTSKNIFSALFLFYAMALLYGCGAKATLNEPFKHQVIEIEQEQFEKLTDTQINSSDVLAVFSLILALFSLALSAQWRKKDITRSMHDEYWFRNVLMPPAVNVIEGLTSLFQSKLSTPITDDDLDEIGSKIEEVRHVFDPFLCLGGGFTRINIQISDILDDLELEIDNAGSPTLPPMTRILHYKQRIFSTLISCHRQLGETF